MAKKSKHPRVPASPRESAMEDGQSGLLPKLRFPEFKGKSAWEERHGDFLFDQINERNADRSFPVLAITQEYGAIPRDMIDYHVSVTEKSIESYKVVRVGDFIISLRSFQGGIEYSQYNGICSPAYVVLRRRNEGSNEYFKHYLKTDPFIRILTRNLEGLRDGKMISYKQFSELLIPIPTPAEQRKIASCLSSLDDLIGAQGRKVDSLRTHKKGLMQQLFPREGETQPRLRFPEFQNDGDWEERSIGQIAKVTTGAKDTQNKVQGGMYPFFVRSQTVERIDSYSYDGEAVLTSGDGAGVGKNFHHIIGKFDFHQRVYCIYDFDRGVDGFFFYLYFAEHFGDRVKRMSAKNSVDSVRMGMIIEMPMFLPSLREQQRIASCLSSLDNLITADTRKLEALKTHKRGLMQQLFPSPDID
jgi:type I restriction enzyme S subunit